MMAEFVDWDSKKIREAVMKEYVGNLEAVGNLIAKKARAKCPAGTKSRAMYQKGKYAGQDWTKRDAGALKKTIRAVMKKGTNDVWIIAGNKKVFYARIVEFYTPFMRPALDSSRAATKRILGAE